MSFQDNFLKPYWIKDTKCSAGRQPVHTLLHAFILEECHDTLGECGYVFFAEVRHGCRLVLLIEWIDRIQIGFECYWLCWGCYVLIEGDDPAPFAFGSPRCFYQAVSGVSRLTIDCSAVSLLEFLECSPFLIRRTTMCFLRRSTFVDQEVFQSI